MLELTFIRHGESQGNVERRIQGQTDSQLTEQGRDQVAALGLALLSSENNFNTVISSPLIRAKGTAEKISSILNIPVFFDKTLQERCFGVLEGLTIEEIRAISPEVDFYDPFIPPAEGAESIHDLYLRACHVLSILVKKSNGNYIIVSHGALLNMLMYAVAGLSPLTNSVRLKFMHENTGYSNVTYDLEKRDWRIWFLNKTDHLNRLHRK